MYLSPDAKRTPTFVKNTNRRYFGAPTTSQPLDMKKSSILLQYVPKETPNGLLGSKSPSVKRNTPTQNIPLLSQGYLEKKDKPQGMSSSMIVPRSD